VTAAGIRVSRDGNLTDRHCHLSVQWVGAAGRPMPGASFEEPFLQYGGNAETVTGTIADALAAITRFNVAQTFQERADPLREIQVALGNDRAALDDNLMSFQLVRADSFSLAPFRRVDGSLDFKVKPIRRTKTDDSGLIPATEDASLPAAHEEAFNQTFDRSNGARTTYVAGGDYYLIASPNLRTALAVVRQAKAGSPEIREAFIRNPLGFLRDQLGDDLPEAELEGLFWEAPEYGARVREVGLWKPRVLPFIVRPSNEWMPPEQMGILIGEDKLTLTAAELPQLLEQLREAQAAGRPTIEVNGKVVPATDDVIQAVESGKREEEGEARRGNRSRASETIRSDGAAHC